MLAHKHSFPDEHISIMFMLYYIDKKALVWKIEFMVAHTVSEQRIHLGTMENFLVAHTVSEQRIHLGTMENFLVALDLVFQLFNIEEDPLWQLHALKQLSRPVDKYISEFRVFAI